VIFAVLDVSLNSDETSKFFVIISAVFSSDFIFFVPQWHRHPSFIKIVHIKKILHPIKPERSVYGWLLEHSDSEKNIPIRFDFQKRFFSIRFDSVNYCRVGV